MTNSSISFKRRVHVRYLLRYLHILPEELSSHDSTRVIIAFFAVLGLDILNSLDALSEEKRTSIINWIYDLQVDNEEDLVCGFQGTTLLNTRENKNTKDSYRWGHVANTYSALLVLVMLGDDLSRVNRSGIIKSLRTLQAEDGCFTAAREGNESDMRFVYCAACICYILDDWSGMDVERTTDFILRSVAYDCGIGQGPGLEAHGGPTFCALATLTLLGRMDCLSAAQRAGLTRWLVFRQLDGFQGRPNKPVDTCYSFWVGAALHMLGALGLADLGRCRQLILSTQNALVGGFSKWADVSPDPLHTCLGLGGLSLTGVDGLAPLVPMLNVTAAGFRRLQALHAQWRAA